MYPVLKLHFAHCDIAPCNRESCYTSTQVFDDDLQPCFERVSAYVKGYLTRRLLKTEKVQEIVRTIQVNSTCVQRAAESGNLLWVFPQNFKINFEGKNWSFKGQFCWPWVICRSSFCLWTSLDTNFAGHQAVCVQFSDRDPHQERCFLSSRQGSAWQDHSSGKHK